MHSIWSPAQITFTLSATLPSLIRCHIQRAQKKGNKSDVITGWHKSYTESWCLRVWFFVWTLVHVDQTGIICCLWACGCLNYTYFCGNPKSNKGHFLPFLIKRVRSRIILECQYNQGLRFFLEEVMLWVQVVVNQNHKTTLRASSLHTFHTEL